MRALMSQPALATEPDTLWSRLRPWLPVMVVIVVLALVALAVRALFNEISYVDVVEAMRNTTPGQIVLALLCTSASYLTLMGYDWSGLRYAGARVPPRTIALASFVGYALGNTVGLGALTGGAVRMRIYSAAGLAPLQVGQVVAFIVAAFGFGVSFVGALGLLWGAGEVSGVTHVPAWLLETLAGLIVFSSFAFFAVCARRRELNIFGMHLRLPTPALAATQLLVSAVDIGFSAATLWFLLPASGEGFFTFVAFYSIAVALGVLSHVPGGLGVFEAVILLAYGGRVPLEQVAGALVLYRAVYYLVPLALATLLLAYYELRKTVVPRVGRATAELSPMFLSVFTFFVGSMLLISGATPATDEATELLSLNVPIQIVEASHFLGSIAGLMLLFVARGLLNRLDAAWWAAVFLAILSFVLALPKGIAVTEMGVIAFQVVALLAGRKEFDRRASLFSHPLSPGWLLTVAAVILASAWIMFFVYQDIDYEDQLWWQFEFDGHAPRSLRATLAVVVLSLGYATWQGFRPAQRIFTRPTDQELGRAVAVVRGQAYADTCLALVGDKSFLFSASGNSFIMFSRRGRTWVALYDPIGPFDEAAELIWRFVELAAESGARPAFYQARAGYLPLYVDAGLQPFKLGEEALVPLRDFTVKGSARSHLRAALNKGEREGLSLEIVPASAVEPLLPELERISDDWLQQHNTREKSFSLGAFDRDYLKRLPLALVRRSGTPVAFANLQCTELKREASVDLMRYQADAPKGAMDYLFVKLMLHFQAEGYESFGLGMAPLSGLAAHPLAPRWQRLGRLVFQHGEHFYNFQGLRGFKEKFEPVWEPRYLCSTGGIAPLLALADIASLTSRGLAGVLVK